MNEPLQRLKAGTNDLHEAAERHVRILDPDATDAIYTRYLVKMYGFHVPLELGFARHAGLEAAGYAAHQRGKRAWLAADLEALGVDVASVPYCTTAPLLGEVARAVGVAYVVEGSMLGGRFILSKMRALSHLVGRATRFLEGYGDDTGARWKQFAQLAATALHDEQQIQRALVGARETFEQLTVWLDEPALEPPFPRKLPRRELQ